MIKMLFLRLLVLCLFICETFTQVNTNNCNPPETLLGKFCAGVFHYDTDNSGIIDLKDLEADMLTYNFDDDLCNVQKWEMKEMWSCRYGYSADFNEWTWPQRDSNKDGVVSTADFDGVSATLSFTREVFLQREYYRMKDEYCNQTQPRTDPIDIRLCAEVNAMKLEDLKCDWDKLENM